MNAELRHQLQGKALYWAATLPLMLWDDAAMLAFMFC